MAIFNNSKFPIRLLPAVYRVLPLVLLITLGTLASAQNYLGYSKGYIIDAMKVQHPELLGPFVSSGSDSNYISYLSGDKNRIVFYLFEKMDVKLQGREKTSAEICVKYWSKTMCPDYTRCPQLALVVRALEANFTNSGHYHIWIDYSKKIPQEWVLDEEDHYFEVHVAELKGK